MVLDTAVVLDDGIDVVEVVDTTEVVLFNSDVVVVPGGTEVEVSGTVVVVDTTEVVVGSTKVVVVNITDVVVVAGLIVVVLSDDVVVGLVFRQLSMRTSSINHPKKV